MSTFAERRAERRKRLDDYNLLQEIHRRQDEEAARTPADFFVDGPRWYRGPTGWVIQGRIGDLMVGLEEPLHVRNRSTGRTDVVHIERVTKPDRYGNAYAWPVGTAAGTFRRSELPAQEAPEPKQFTNVKRRRSGGRRATRERQRRS